MVTINKKELLSLNYGLKARMMQLIILKQVKYNEKTTRNETNETL